MFGIGAPELIVLLLYASILGVFFIWPFWRIFSKAGFSGWLSLTLIIPLLNIIMLFYLAFSEWPALRKSN